MLEVARCSYCEQPLPDDEESTPNLFVHNKSGKIMLLLHTECIREVMNGLKLGEQVTTC